MGMGDQGHRCVLEFRRTIWTSQFDNLVGRAKGRMWPQFHAVGSLVVCARIGEMHAEIQ